MCKKIIINIISLYFILVPLFCFAIEYNEELFNNNVNTAQQKLSPVEQQMYNQWFSSKEQYENNLVKPLTTGTTLYTLDRQKTYNDAQIMCPGSEGFIEILIQPGPTKDLNFIQIKYDSNLDGTYDGNYYESGPVSGICANGIIKCRAGTWDACKYYKWKFDGHSLSKEEVNPNDLGGCYCINSYCTSTSFWNFKDQVLTSIGGGIAAAMSEVNPDLGISSDKIDGYHIQYFAQNTGACSYSIPGQLQSEGITNPEDITPGQLEALTAQEQESQANNEDSIYYTLTHSQAYTTTNTQTCEKRRIINLNTDTCQIESYIIDGCTNLENNPNCRLRTEKVYDKDGYSVTTYTDFNPTGLSLLECKKNIINRCEVSTQEKVLNVAAVGNTEFTLHLAPVYFSSTPAPSDPITFSICTVTHGTGNCFDDDINIAFYVEGTRVIYHDFEDADSYSIHTFSINLSHFHPGDNNCKFSATGAEHSYVGGTRKLTLNIPCPPGYQRDPDAPNICFHCPDGYSYDPNLHQCVSNECFNWWRIERTYECQESNTVRPDLTRIEYVDNTIQETSTGIKYNDIMKVNNYWQSFPNQKIDFKKKQQDVCIHSCKIIKNIDPAEVGAGDYTSADYRHDPSHIQYIYRTCIDDVCPLEEGEEMVEPCSCINEFNRVVSVGEVIKLSTIDMICSSGQKIK